MEEGYYGPWLLPNRGQRRNQIQNYTNSKNNEGITKFGKNQGGPATRKLDSHNVGRDGQQQFVSSAKYSKINQDNTPDHLHDVGQSRFSVLANLEEEQYGIEEVQDLQAKMQQPKMSKSSKRTGKKLEPRFEKNKQQSFGGISNKKMEGSKQTIGSYQNVKNQVSTVEWTKVVVYIVYMLLLKGNLRYSYYYITYKYLFR